MQGLFAPTLHLRERIKKVIGNMTMKDLKLELKNVFLHSSIPLACRYIRLAKEKSGGNFVGWKIYDSEAPVYARKKCELSLGLFYRAIIVRYYKRQPLLRSQHW